MKRVAAMALLLCIAACTSASESHLQPVGGGPSNRAENIYFAWAKDGAKQMRAYDATADGNVSPTTVIAGLKTKLDSPVGAYVAPSGALFTCNFVGRVLGFASGTSGNVAPTRNIGGPNTELRGCFAAAMHAGRVAAVGVSFANAVAVWGMGLTGNVKPTSIIAGKATQLDAPVDVAFDGSGQLYVANNKSNALTVYASTAGGNIAPLRSIAGSKTGLSGPWALCIDKNANLIYVANLSGKTITAYGLSQSGDVAPSVTIGGSNTGLDRPRGVAVDAAGYLYVSNNPSNEPGFITVYAPGSNGDAAPVQTIKGSKVDVSGHIAVK